MAEIFNSSMFSQFESQEQKAERVYLQQVLTELTKNIISLLIDYTPVDTGRLLSSLYVKADRMDIIRIGFDLKKCPYAIYVHEIPNKDHGPYRDHFLLDALVNGVAATPGAEHINTDILIVGKNDLLEAILNSSDDVITAYTNKINNENNIVDQYISTGKDIFEEKFSLEDALGNLSAENITGQLFSLIDNNTLETIRDTHEALRAPLLKQALRNNVQSLNIEMPEYLKKQRKRARFKWEH